MPFDGRSLRVTLVLAASQQLTLPLSLRVGFAICVGAIAHWRSCNPAAVVRLLDGYAGHRDRDSFKKRKGPTGCFQAACLHAGRLIRVATLEARRCTADGEVLIECYILAGRLRCGIAHHLREVSRARTQRLVRRQWAAVGSQRKCINPRHNIFLSWRTGPPGNGAHVQTLVGSDQREQHRDSSCASTARY